MEAVLETYHVGGRTDRRKDASRKTIELLLRILESLGMVFYREEDRDFDVNELRPLSKIIPPVPAMLPDGLIEESDVRSQEAGPFLRDVFGYGGPTPNDNQVGRRGEKPG